MFGLVAQAHGAADELIVHEHAFDALVVVAFVEDHVQVIEAAGLQVIEAVADAVAGVAAQCGIGPAGAGDAHVGQAGVHGAVAERSRVGRVVGRAAAVQCHRRAEPGVDMVVVNK